jgi:uncharacterized protein (TIGR02391 family)
MYRDLIQPKAQPGNLKIIQELKYVNSIISTITEQMPEEEYDVDSLTMSLGKYKLLSDTLWKYWASLNSELRVKREEIAIEGELEQEESELDRLTEILKYPFFEQIPRRKTLVDNLKGAKGDSASTEDQNAYSKETMKRVANTEIFDRYDLHPEIKRVAFNQFQDGYYKEAIQNAFVEVIDTVKRKTNNPKKTQNGRTYDLDGEDLMQHVFGADNGAVPTIKLNELNTSLDRAEQRGLMYIYKGIVGIRDRKAHLNDPQNDPVKTIEYLSLASLLMRLLDEKA